MTTTHGELRIEPASEILEATRRWLAPVRAALGSEFLSAYLTGSVLTQGFDPAHSRVNVLVVSRTLSGEMLDALAAAIPTGKRPPHFDPLFLTHSQILKSLDVFPIEWLDIREQHLRIEGDDLCATLEVPRTNLRLQCEHELRGKHIRLRQAYLLAPRKAPELTHVLKTMASSFAALFRTLLRLRDEKVPSDTAHVIQRVADVYGLDATGLLGLHLLRYSAKQYKADEVLAIYRRFLVEIERLVNAIDQLSVT